jgi:hypothetical protein
MACHEIAALRLGLMRVLGRTDEAERQHELAELGHAASQTGPMQALCASSDLASLKRAYDTAIAGLEERVAATAGEDPKLPYLRTLVVLTKKVELDLEHHWKLLAPGHLYASVSLPASCGVVVWLGVCR